MAEARGSIAYFTTYRPPVPLDIFSTSSSPTEQDEVPMTDGVAYNYNGQVIPPAALKIILKRPKLASEGFRDDDVDSGRLSAMIFISERENLETLHIALHSTDNPAVLQQVKIFSFADVFGTFDGVRMEDSGCVAGDHHLVYVTTKDPAAARRQPWTAVYKTNLKTASTERLTPPGEADLSPSVSPSGTKIAVASFEEKGGWAGEIEDLKTDIFVMNVDGPMDRRLVVRNGGWPTWGSDNVLFFHRKVGENWGVFQADIGDLDEPDISRVTPDDFDAITPAAISPTRVAVATIRRKSKLSDLRVDPMQYRHIEIFDLTGGQVVKITQENRPMADHFNPFVMDGGKRIGYHRCRTDLVIKSRGDTQKQLDKVVSPDRDIGLFRVSGVFPSFSRDGTKLAFIDNEFKTLLIADSQGLHTVEERADGNKMFWPVWNQDPEKQTLYVCMGPSFKDDQIVHICAIPEASDCSGHRGQLTRGFNNACPSTNPQGTKLVYRSTRDGGEKKHKNLYIMEDAKKGEYHDGKITRLTKGEWTDTHCQWSPSGDWIVFSSTRDKPKSAPESDNDLDPGFFAVYLVKWNDPSVLVRVIGSGNDLAGHLNHPFFSPDGKSIVVTADLAAVSVDPISLPRFLHSVRPYGDIFTVDIDPNDIYKNQNLTDFNRITHSRFENSTGTWTTFSTHDPNAAWNLLQNKTQSTPVAEPEEQKKGCIASSSHDPKAACNLLPHKPQCTPVAPRGSIAFFATYRPPAPLDIFSRDPLSRTPRQDELPMTDRVSYNYNGQVIPPSALKVILNRPKLASQGFKEADVDSGRLSGIVFVSERGNLETLHIALRFATGSNNTEQVKVFSFADVFGTFDGVRMEDSGCVAGDHHLVYVTTKDPAAARRQPWTAVYKTNLKTASTERLTPSGVANLSPSVSPSGMKIAVASFEEKGGWAGEIEDLKTDIFVMNVDRPLNRRLVVRNGGWPTWGSDTVLFFHRKVGRFWGVFRANLGDLDEPDISRVTPDDIDAVTPAAINATKVAVATIREKSEFGEERKEAQYRHIEIFDSTGGQPLKITQKTRPRADHFNPFVIDGGKRIGYHRCRTDIVMREGDIQRQFDKLDSPNRDIGLFRVSGVFPTFSKDGSKLVFIDTEFKAIWLADSRGLRIVYEFGVDSVFSPVWNQDPAKDVLYICKGKAFQPDLAVNICAIPDVSSGRQQRNQLTKGSNNAFPSTNPDGTKLVFRSTRHGGPKRHKNLYIMEDAQKGEYHGGKITRLTQGEWTDTHCQWSPSEDWIVFSSTRDKPNRGVPDLDNELDPGFFAVYLVKWNDPSVLVRVLGSGNDLAGHVNHPFFSPDGKSIVVAADLAAVSVDPMSLPLLVHSVRPYGDIFTVDIDTDDIYKNQDVSNFSRITHSRYENSTAVWTLLSTDRDPNATWNLQLPKNEGYTPSCPYMYTDGGESPHMTGHICIPKRYC